MNSVIEFGHPHRVGLVVGDLSFDFREAHRIPQGLQVLAVDGAVRQRHQTPQRPRIPGDPISFIGIEAAPRPIDRTLRAKRCKNPNMAEAFGEAPIIQPAPVPLAALAAEPRDDDRNNDHELDTDKHGFHLRLVNEDADKRQRHGERREQEIEDITAAIDVRIINSGMIRGGKSGQQ